MELPKLSAWKQPTNSLFFPLALALLCLVMMGILWVASPHLTHAVEQVELSLLDQRLRFRAQDLTPSKDIVFVAFDNETKKFAREHPELGIGDLLPRARLAQVIRYLHQEGAKGVLLDVFLEVPREGDAELAKAIGEAGNVYINTGAEITFAEFLEREAGGKSVAPARPADFGRSEPITGRYLSSASDPQTESWARFCMDDLYQRHFRRNPEFLPLLEKSRLALSYAHPPSPAVEQRMSNCRVKFIQPDFMRASRGVGITTVYYDTQDAYLRSAPTVYRAYRGGFYGMLPFMPVLEAWGKPAITYSPSHLQVGSRRIDLVDGRSVIVNWRNPARLAAEIYRGAGGALDESAKSQIAGVRSELNNRVLGYGHLYRMVSVSDILKAIAGDKQTPSLYNLYGNPASGRFSFKGKYVIYGDATLDIHRTPMGSTTFGPEYNAAVLDMLLHDTKFVHPSPLWMNFGVTLLLCGAGVWLVVAQRRLYFGIAASGVLLLAFWANNFMVFKLEALWFPMVWPTILYAGAFAAALLFRYQVQDREKRLLTNVFSKFVSPQVMEQILINPANSTENLKGSRKELTVLFADIHNFTSQFENAEPEHIVEQLNEYFNVMTRIVLAHGGTYDKYMGDALMAFFGAPTDLPDHAVRACRAALEMEAALVPLNERWAQEGRPLIRHGIGLSTGPVFVGYFGSDDIKNFTVMGANVNLGSRLENYTRQVDAPILISERTREQADGTIRTRDLGEVVIKGFTHPIRIYALEGAVQV